MSIPLLFQNEIRKIDAGLFLERYVNQDGEWIKIKHKDSRNGLVRDCFKVRQLDYETLKRIRFTIDWEAMLKNPDPKQLEAHYALEFKKEKAARELERMGFITDWRKSNKLRHKQMFEDYRQNLRTNEVRAIKRDVQKQEYLKPRQIKIYQS